MANISSTYANAAAGKLTIAFSAKFYQSSASAGFPSGSSDMLLCVTINGINSPTINRASQSIYTEMDYPGGGVVWSVSTTVIAAYGSGASQYGFTNLTVKIGIIKTTGH